MLPDLSPADALVRAWVDRLPDAALRALEQAALGGPAAVSAVRDQTASPPLVHACAQLAVLVRAGDGPYVAGLLRGVVVAREQTVSVLPVWTGPESPAGGGRLTVAVVADLLATASHEIVLASYATHPSTGVRGALREAVERGVDVTLLLEHPADRPGFSGPSDPFPGLSARRLRWRAAVRPAGAAMHAKLLVVDRRVALVGSANLTGHALTTNLECGLVVHGGAVPGLLVDHLRQCAELVVAAG